MANRIRMLSRRLLETSNSIKSTNDDNNIIYDLEKDENLRVQFIHKSMRDFFIIDDGQIIFGKEVDDNNFIEHNHELLKQSCINYITFEDISKVNRRYDILELVVHNEIINLNDQDRCLTRLELARDLKFAYSFLDYAIDSIFYHASRVETTRISQISLGRSYLSQANKLFDLWASLHSIMGFQYHYSSVGFQYYYSSVTTKRRLALLELAEYDVINCLRYIQESGTSIDFANDYRTISL